MISSIDNVDSKDGNEPIDRLLADFFQAQTPKPWPAFRQPGVWHKPRRSQQVIRMTLAASFLFVVSGYALLLGAFSSSPTSSKLDRGATFGAAMKRDQPLNPPSPVIAAPEGSTGKVLVDRVPKGKIR